MLRTRRKLKNLSVGVCLASFVLLGATASSAQEPSSAPDTASADPTTPQASTEPPATSAPPSATPAPETPTPSPSTAPPSKTPQTSAPAPLPSPTPAPSQTPEAQASPVPAPEPRAPVLPRTPPRDTNDLVTELHVLTEWGVPLDDVLAEGMGHFPVSGRAHYSDDWLAARYEPTFHLHEGLDIFADFGTPIRAPMPGVITKLSDAYPGGISVTMRDYLGTTYYFAHLMNRAEGLEVGHSVELGTLIGTVGDTGNAEGGAPHLHFEIERFGNNLPPKPTVDRWLDEAEAAAGDWLERRRVEIEIARRASEEARQARVDSLVELLLEATALAGPVPVP